MCTHLPLKPVLACQVTGSFPRMLGSGWHLLSPREALAVLSRAASVPAWVLCFLAALFPCTHLHYHTFQRLHVGPVMQHLPSPLIDGNVICEVFKHAHVHTHTHTVTQAHKSTLKHTHTHIHIDTGTQKHTQTYTHTHTHTHYI